MTRATLDTNVLVSVFAKPKGAPGEIYQLWKEGRFDLAISAYILKELERVLVKKLGLKQSFVDDRLHEFYTLAFIVDPIELEIKGIQSKDLPIIGTALAGHASMLVTGDKQILKFASFDNVRIVSPQKFLAELR